MNSSFWFCQHTENKTLKKLDCEKDEGFPRGKEVNKAIIIKQNRNFQKFDCEKR